MIYFVLTHISLASLLWDIGKQYSPRCDAIERVVPSGAILFAQRNVIEKRDKKNKNTPNTPKNESGITQLIMMGESIRQIWVNSCTGGGKTSGHRKHLNNFQALIKLLQYYICSNDTNTWVCM